MQVDFLNLEHHDYKLQNNAGLGSIAVSIKVPHKKAARFDRSVKVMNS